jgi:hypothetical protein
MTYFTWTFVDTQDDLDLLENIFDWDEAELLEFHGCLTNETYFPQDISRSGSNNMNVHMLMQLSRHGESDPDFIELILIDCDLLSLTYMHCPQFKGRVDSLRRVSIEADGSGTDMRCARLIYRTIQDRDQQEVRPHLTSYFKTADSLQ